MNTNSNENLIHFCSQAAQLHRIYDREVVELDENVSFLIVFPPPEDVCSAPGQMDSLSHKKAFISLPVQTFEMSESRLKESNDFIIKV